MYIVNNSNMKIAIVESPTLVGFFVYRHLGLVRCNLVLMKRFLPLLMLNGLLFGQDVVETYPIDTLSQLITLDDVEKQAWKDALENFQSQGGRKKWFKNGCLSIIFPPAYIYILWSPGSVNLPKNREEFLGLINDEYKLVYQGEYKKRTKTLRRKYVLVSFGVYYFIVMGTYFVLGPP